MGSRYAKLPASISSQIVMSPKRPASEVGPGRLEVWIMSTRDMMFAWFRIRDTGTDAVGRIADASLVVVVCFFASFVTTFGILEARNDALSLVRMTCTEDAMC